MVSVLSWGGVLAVAIIAALVLWAERETHDEDEQQRRAWWAKRERR